MKQALIEITTNCNKNCKFCYNNFSKHTNGKEISLEQLCFIKNILKRENISKIAFTGGEPLIYSKLDAALELFDDFEITIITNGYALTPNIINKIKQKKINLRITLDFTPKAWKIRDLIIQNDYLKNTIFQITIYNEDLSEIKTFVEKWCKTTIPLQINYAMFKGKATYSSQNILHFLELSKYLILKILLYNWSISGTYIDLIISNYYTNHKCTPDCSLCEVIKIDIDGNVFPCPFMTEETFIAGNIYLNTYKNISNNMNNIKSELENCRKTYCTSCKWKKKCKGGCLVEKKEIICTLNNNLYSFMEYLEK